MNKIFREALIVLKNVTIIIPLIEGVIRAVQALTSKDKS